MPGRAVGGRPLKGYQLAAGPSRGMEVCPDHIARHQTYTAGMGDHAVIPLYRKPKCADCKVEERLKR